MPYEPTEWVRGTKITASKLNNIESGVESVNSEYTPTTWAEGDIVTATKLNNIEQGIANASGGGGGDFSTATVTIINTTGDMVVADEPEPVLMEGVFASAPISAAANSTKTWNMVTYQGVAYILFAPIYNISIVGDAEADEDILVTVNGDCTITIS